MKLFGKKHRQYAARRLHNDFGIEMTPDELDEERRKAYATIRRKMAERGWDVGTDEDLFYVLTALRESGGMY